MKVKFFLIATLLIQTVLFQREYSLWRQQYEYSTLLLRIIAAYQADGRVPCRQVALRRPR